MTLDKDNLDNSNFYDDKVLDNRDPKLPEYFNPLLDVLETMGMDRRHGISLSLVLNNIMNVKIQLLKNELDPIKE